MPTLIGGWVPALYGALLVPLARSAHAIGQLPDVGLVMLAVLLLLRPMWASTQQWAPGALVGVGCGLVCIGLLPYLVVGKYPTLQDPSIWSSRFDYLAGVERLVACGDTLAVGDSIGFGAFPLSYF